jgi:hypothetical protein
LATTLTKPQVEANQTKAQLEENIDKFVLFELCANIKLGFDIKSRASGMSDVLWQLGFSSFV